MPRIVITVLLGAVISLTSTAQGTQTMSARFVREVTQGDVTEQVFGSLYCELPDRVVLRVTSPVNQWMVFEKNLTTIYYPEPNTAFRITSRFSPYPPFVQSLAAAQEADYGLSRLGYRPTNCEVRGDTIISRWTPPKPLALVLGETLLKICGDKIIYVESRTADGRVVRRSLNTAHEYLRGTYFPVEILTTEYSKEDSTLERVSFSGLAVDSVLPEELTGFSIPANATVKEVEW